MTIIGTFVPIADGYVGHIITLTVRRRVRILINYNDTATNAPDFKLLCGETEIGAAWKAITKGDRPYLSVQIDDPSWPAPIKTSLFEYDALAHLVWCRKSMHFSGNPVG
jgi:uncharacterized protein (DUF736 family)